MISIIGRSNTGKSTLFNRLVKRKISITDKALNLTRDVIIAKAYWNGKTFYVADTGGITDEEDEITKEVLKKIKEVLKKSEKIIFLVDGSTGILPFDKEIAKVLYPYKEKVVVGVNKFDVKKANVYDFYELGFEKVIPISASRGEGINDLLDEVTKDISSIEETEKSFIKISFVGRPNVGKSSLLNAILKEERVMVSSIAGTTRDAVDVEFNYKGKDFLLVDTAGMRRASNVEFGPEFFAVNRTLKAIERADISILVLDAKDGVTRQDKKIAGLLLRRSKGIIVFINKIDLIDNKEYLLEHVKKELNFIYFAPFILGSAKMGLNTFTVLDKALDLYDEYTKIFKTSFINRVIEKIIEESPPQGSKEPKVYYASQVRSMPPTFVLNTNSADLWKENYKKFFEKKLREKLKLNHTPINIIFEEHSQKE